MNYHPTLPSSRLSRRSVVGRAAAIGAALSLGSRLGRVRADEATPSAGAVEFLWETSGDPDSPLGKNAGEFEYTLGVAVGGDGTVYVTDEAKRLRAFHVGDLTGA